MARKVRTQRGVSRYNKPIGAIIGETRGGVLKAFTPLEQRAENLPGRHKTSYGQRQKTRRATVQRAAGLRQRALAGDKTLSWQESNSVRYASPTKIREAKRTQGHDILTQKDLNDRVRGRSKAHRDVTFNPAVGKFRTSRDKISGDAENFDRVIQDKTGRYLGSSRRARSSGSAARVKARKAPAVKPVTEYVGRRRAKD